METLLSLRYIIEIQETDNDLNMSPFTMQAEKMVYPALHERSTEKKSGISLCKREVRGARYLVLYEISLSNRAEPERPKKLLTIGS
jgi:hypothetical protein